MTGAPGSLEVLRRANRARVLAVLGERGRASRAEIVRATGLARSTVSSLVGELLADGAVVERSDGAAAPPSPAGGRPPTMLELDPASGVFVGLDFGHDDVVALVADRAGRPLADGRERLDVDHRADDALALAATMTDEVLHRAGVSRARVLRVGAAVSAPLRSHTHAVASDRIFAGWADVDVGAALGARLQLPVEVGNDANLGALAEATFGAGRGVRNLLYVMLSAGTGAGIILDGHLYEGDAGTAGEIGHVIVDPDGQVCRCGNRGCLETVAGIVALTGALRHTYGPDASLDDLLTLIAAGDLGARRLIADAGRKVGEAAAAACSVLDPGMLIVGGELAAAGDVLIDAVRETIDHRTSQVTGHPCPVVAGELGSKAEALGGIALAMRATAATGA
jgi:predicted NBD/HSP70 family sugar kinase